MHPLRLSLFALLLLAVLGLSQEAEGGLVEVYVNDVDLVIAEDVVTVESETDFDVIIRLSGSYRIHTEDNLSVALILLQIDFLNDEDPRNSVMGIPEYQPIGDNQSDPGYDEYRSRFRSNDVAFENYHGDFQIVMVMKNESGELIWNTSFDGLHMPYKPKPDLFISEMTFSNVNPEIGEEITINATVKLVGVNVTDNFSVGFYLGAIPSENGTEIGSQVVNGSDMKLGIDYQYFVSINWTAVDGSHTIYVVADSTDVIEESTEKNVLSSVIVVSFVEPEQNETSETTDNNEETTSDSVEKEDEEVDYTLPIIGIGVLIAASILGAAVILKR